MEASLWLEESKLFCDITHQEIFSFSLHYWSCKNESANKIQPGVRQISFVLINDIFLLKPECALWSVYFGCQLQKSCICPLLYLHCILVRMAIFCKRKSVWISTNYWNLLQAESLKGEPTFYVNHVVFVAGWIDPLECFPGALLFQQCILKLIS